MQTNNASKIIAAIGEDRLVAVHGFTLRNLRHIRASGKFPAAWYAAIFDECAMLGIPCPRAAFNFNANANKLGNGNLSFQGEARENMTSGDAA